MEQITSLSEHISDNRIIADAQKSSMDGSKIIFNGSGNILVIEDGAGSTHPPFFSTAATRYAI